MANKLDPKSDHQGKGITNGNLRLRYRLVGAGARAHSIKFLVFIKYFEILKKKSNCGENPKGNSPYPFEYM